MASLDEAQMPSQAAPQELPKRSSAQKDKFLELARKRFKRAMEMDEDNRRHALECLRFRNLEQWDDQAKRARENDPEGARPCIVMDKTNQYLNQLINDYRQNRPGIKVRPVDDRGDKEVAEIFQGVIRHIEDKSWASAAYENAYENSADGGFGYIRVLTEYCDEMSADQDIRIAKVMNRFTILLDPDREMPHRPPEWGFVIDKVLREDFKEEYPDADEMNYSTSDQVFKDWCFKDYLIIAEYFYTEKERKKVCYWPDGSHSFKGDPRYAGLTPVSERDTVVKAIKWAKITGADILEERDWPGAYVPIIEFVGTELNIEGKSVKSGLLKGSMTPQIIHNYAASSFIESIGMAPRSPWTVPEQTLDKYGELYRTANRRAISALPYVSYDDENRPLNQPTRIPPAGLSVGWLQAMQTSEHDIQASMGTYANTSLGQGDAQSGKQEMLQQRRGDTANFHYADNASRSIGFCGTVLIDLIPKIIDTRRVLRIIGEDGESDQVEIDPNQEEAVRKVSDDAGAVKKIYNLGVGKYDLTVSVGPSYSSKRLEASEFLSNAASTAKDPTTAMVMNYLAIKNNDWAGADEASKMLKKMLPAELKGDEEENEDGPKVETPRGPVSLQEAGQIIAQLEQSMQQAQQVIEKADIMSKQAEAQKAQADEARAHLEREREAHAQNKTMRELELEERKVGISEYEAVTARLAAQASAIAKGVDINGQEAAATAELDQTIARSDAQIESEYTNGQLAN